MRSKYRLIWDLMAGQRLRYGAAIGAMVLGSSFMYLAPLVPQVVIDGILGQPAAEESALVRTALALGGGREFLRERLWIPGLCIVVLTAAAGIFTYLRGRWSATASEAIARRVRDLLYDQLQHLPCSYHDKAETGDQVQRCTSDVETFRQFLANQVVEIGRAIIMMVVPLPLMLALDARMTLVAVVTIPPIVIFSIIFFRRVQSSFKRVDEAEGRLTSALQENLTGIRVVRAFARQEYEKERFGAKNATHRDLDYRLYVLMAWYWSVSDFVCMGQKALVLGAGGYWLATGEIRVGTFYFFLAAVTMFIWPIRMMGRILTELGKALVSIGRIAEILEHPRESEIPEAGMAGRPAEGGAEARGEVEFRSVSFAHGEGKVLDGVSFRVAPGQTLALLGPSGSGKSTIVNLLLRFNDPDAGSILLDGREIRTLGRKAVRSQIAVVLQEPFLYSKNLRDNIALGRASAAEEEIVRAASIARVHDTIVEFEQGYETLVGERGVTLSGGQRQRVAIARALLEDPPVLVLDDALSAVDTDTETMILEGLERESRRRTTIVIAHRLSTLMRADSILVLDKGRIVQQGSHETLVTQDGPYKRLWRIQCDLENELDMDAGKTKVEAGSRG